jgi:hypothetical protein
MHEGRRDEHEDSGCMEEVGPTLFIDAANFGSLGGGHAVDDSGVGFGFGVH